MELKTIRKVYRLRKKHQLDGDWIQFYKGDRTKVERLFTIKNNQLHGEYISSNINGITTNITNYEYGEKIGWQISWYYGGNIKDSILY